MPLIAPKKYSPWISLLKGLRAALITLIPIIVTTLVGAITPEMLVELGIPLIIAVSILEALRNALKYWKNSG